MSSPNAGKGIAEMDPIYADTSALVKYYYPEPESDLVEAALIGADRVLVSHLSVVEFASALGTKVRTGGLKKNEETTIWEAFQEDLQAGAMEMVDIDERHYTKAAGIVRRFAHGFAIKTLDALHLAIVLDLGDCMMLSTDETLVRVAGRLGIRRVRI